MSLFGYSVLPSIFMNDPCEYDNVTFLHVIHGKLSSLFLTC